MKHRYLQVVFWRGKAFAAYLYLPRKIGAKVARTEDHGQGLQADLDASDCPIGIEITSPSVVTLAEVNRLLITLSFKPLSWEEREPLRVA
jgi:hypothetical protein